MAKLYFKYGAMGSSKTAQALITRFNYMELGMSVWLIKPSVDTRDGADVIKSRIGLEARAQVITPEQDIIAEYQKQPGHDVIIADEAQFFTPAQIDQLRQLVDEEDIPVLCFGLRTDFLTHFFPGAQRLMELADSLTEIKTVCACGRKATVNARIDASGRIITQGTRSFWAAMTAMWPCATNAGSSASGNRKKRKPARTKKEESPGIKRDFLPFLFRQLRRSRPRISSRPSREAAIMAKA